MGGFRTPRLSQPLERGVQGTKSTASSRCLKSPAIGVAFCGVICLGKKWVQNNIFQGENKQAHQILQYKFLKTKIFSQGTSRLANKAIMKSTKRCGPHWHSNPKPPLAGTDHLGFLKGIYFRTFQMKFFCDKKFFPRAFQRYHKSNCIIYKLQFG